MAFMAPQNTAHPNARYDDKLNWTFVEIFHGKSKDHKTITSQ